MDTVWRATVPTRRFTRRVGTGLSGRGAGVRPNVRKGRRRRLKPTGLATDIHAVTCGFDSRNRLSSDTDKRDGYMPPSVSGFAVSQDSSDQ